MKLQTFISGFGAYRYWSFDELGTGTLSENLRTTSATVHEKELDSTASPTISSMEYNPDKYPNSDALLPTSCKENVSSRNPILITVSSHILLFNIPSPNLLITWNLG